MRPPSPQPKFVNLAARFLGLIWVMLAYNSKTFAQSANFESELLKLTIAARNLTDSRPPEKLYLQFDKPYYSVGDTIWFKTYLLNAADLTATNKSDIMYIDIANDSDKVISRYRLPVQHGLSWGNITLDEKGFAPGTYSLRAYTNWMRNFGDDYFFYKRFYIASANENNLLVTTRFSTSAINGVQSVSGKLLFSSMDKVPYAVEPLTLQVMDGNKHLYKQKVRTGVDGVLDVNFPIPQKSQHLIMVAENEQKNKKAVIPVVLNRPENTDVQFLPEGGSLVAGLPARIGFKAISEDGKGTNISGVVTDHNQQQVAEFKSLHNGMGSFYLTPKDGESYTAKVALHGGKIKEYPLPAVKNTGMVLKIKSTLEGDSIEVFVAATDNIIRAGGSYFLVGKARGVVCYAAIFSFRDGNYMKKKIAKNLFPSGIAHFTIMTPGYQPLNERLVYIDRHDNLNIQLTTDKLGYHARDSIALKIKVTDDRGNPIAGNFSLAVTDDAQVKTDTLSDNLVSRMLLTADLKGFIEEPGYYFSAANKDRWTALDNLLLTQGWIGYNLQQVLNPPAITYQPEHEFTVKGRVLNVFNKPVKGTDVLLFSKSPSILMDTVTDKEGGFIFSHFPRADTPIFVLKTVNKNGKSFNVGIAVDEIKPPDLIKPAGPLTDPWYVNSDTTLLNYAKRSAAAKQLANFPAGGHILNEVKIRAKKIVKDSKNLNGPGNADLVLDEKDMEAAGKKTWLQLFEEKIKGFRVGDVGKQWPMIQDIKPPIHIDPGTVVTPTHEWYFVNNKPVKFFVDGLSVTELCPTSLQLVFTYSEAFNDITNYFNGSSAEDIKGIELNFSTKYSYAYVPIEFAQLITGNDVASIEITTRSGHGPIIRNTPGMYLYKPLPLSWPKQFYKPKYIVKDTDKHLPDLRSTIDWEPNIVTNANGEARIFFYADGSPSAYTVTIEGTDMNGSLGSASRKITVGK